MSENEILEFAIQYHDRAAKTWQECNRNSIGGHSDTAIRFQAQHELIAATIKNQIGKVEITFQT